MVLDDTLPGKGKIPAMLAADHLLALTFLTERKECVKLLPSKPGRVEKLTSSTSCNDIFCFISTESSG